MYESRRVRVFTLSISCFVQWENVHLALLLRPSANVHSLKEKNKMALNQTEQLHLKRRVPLFKGSSFTQPLNSPYTQSSPPRLLNGVKVNKNKQKTPNL